MVTQTHLVIYTKQYLLIIINYFFASIYHNGVPLKIYFQ